MGPLAATRGPEAGRFPSDKSATTRVWGATPSAAAAETTQSPAHSAASSAATTRSDRRRRRGRRERRREVMNAFPEGARGKGPIASSA